MASRNQQQQPEISQRWGSGSNRIAAINVEGTTPSPIVTTTNNDDKSFDDQQKPGWKKFVAFIGPGFLISMAYIDPGSLETGLQAGSIHQYELLWVILIGLIFALIIQSLAANLGVCTGKHLSELCKVEYPKYVNYSLCLLAEIAVINADIPEVIGTAFALNILLHIPVWVGVLITGLSTMLLLGLQRYGMRKLEMLIAIFVFIIAGCFFGEMGYVKPPAVDVFKGLFIPKLSGQGAVSDTIALLGANVMPHNLFLHSALVLSRKVPSSVRGINDACRYFLIESAVPMFIALLINVAMVSVTGAVCSRSNLSENTIEQCNNVTLDSASFLLKNVLGKSSSIVYGLALLASGQSSSITGTYAGQFIMQGFLDIKMRQWLNNLMTRCISITPSLIVSIIGGPQGAGRLIIISSMILSFELPFALIPLLKFSNSSSKMGPHKNSIYIIVISWILSLGMIGINVYFLSTGFIGWLIHNDLPKVGNVFIGIVVFPLMIVYILALIYLVFRKDTVVTFIQPTEQHPVTQVNIENELANPNGQMELDCIPYREDLVDIPLPQ
ncbi:metal transporter Nramp5-like [Mangifera indica]|uniref:metal transporter Nramp5-like n=1 Tax=Mangifera indica TaxID=29780 RepID=UPI001CF9B103|nr:metal transporter Nramp5-like [Mangifera indica]